MGAVREAALLAGGSWLHPPPLRVTEDEVLGPGGRLVATRLSPRLYAGERVLLLLYRGSPSELLPFARLASILAAVGYALGGGAWLEIATLDTVPEGLEEHVAGVLGSSRWMASYPLWRLGFALGDPYAPRRRAEEGTVLDCGECPRSSCRAAALYLSTLGVLRGVIVEGRSVEPRSFVDEGLLREAREVGGEKLECRVVDGVVASSDCRLERLMLEELAGSEVLEEVERFASKTRLGFCKALYTLGFKALFDAVVKRRVL